MSYLLDAAGPISDAVLRQPGVVGVVRYVSSRVASQPRGKDLSRAEAQHLRSLGKSISLVWETTAARAFDGGAAGEADARDANAEADYLGYPADCPIFFACDTDAQPGQVQPYFAGVKATSRRPVGVYGGAIIVNAAMKDWGYSYGWQANARSWDHGLSSPQAHLHQHVGHPSLSAPGSYDENVLSHDFKRWGATPVPAPTPTPPPPPEETAMPAPAITVDYAGRDWVFVKGTDGHLYGKRGDEAWKNYGGLLTAGPAAEASLDRKEIVVVVRGAPYRDHPQHSSYKLVIDADTTDASGWFDLGGDS